MILLDVDGVCADFVGGALRAHGSPLTHADIVRYNMAPIMGISNTELWRVIDEGGPEFWRDLDPLPWFDQLYNGLKAIARVEFVTQPGWSWESYAGKKMWFDKMLGRQFRGITFTCSKDLMARPTRVLVDDAPENVASFLAAGGEACLFPSPWNGSPMPDDLAIDEVITKVRRKLQL